jgi:hypothetical protein
LKQHFETGLFPVNVQYVFLAEQPIFILYVEKGGCHPEINNEKALGEKMSGRGF